MLPDGTPLGARGARAASLAVRRLAPAASDSPGPGTYAVPSAFEPRSPFRADRAAGYLGERPASRPPPPSASPGPAAYHTEAFDAIGTDRVAIGAAARAQLGRSATEAARAGRDPGGLGYLYGSRQLSAPGDDGAGSPPVAHRPQPLLNYSAMNKAAQLAKEALQEVEPPRPPLPAPR